ncbi:MAG: NUDIX domain-containing protein [bacterium]|nr:NUDIX domain-containing protein [bacterium]
MQEQRAIRCEAVIIKDNKILLIYCKKRELEYYVLPGGSLEANETLEQCVLREIKEETTVIASVEKLLYVYDIKDDLKKYLFLCKYISGEPRIGEGNEREELKNDKNLEYIPSWYPLDSLKNLHLIYTLEFRDWLLQNNERLSEVNEPCILKISREQQMGWRHK